MSQHSPYATGTQHLVALPAGTPSFLAPCFEASAQPYASDGHFPNLNGTHRSSALERHHGPAEVDPLDLQLFDSGSGATPALIADLDIADMSSIPKAMAPPDDRSRFAGGEVNDRLFQFWCDRDGPWNQEKFRVRGHPEALPPSFTGFRETTAPSECATSIGPGTLQSDSGYGSQARQSVGIPSVYGDVDRSAEPLTNQLAETQLFHGPSYSSFAAPWTPGTIDPPNAVPTNNTPNYTCHICSMRFRGKSDYKKHMDRHEKPHICTEPGCSWAFGTPNDRDRHEKSKHHKPGTRYRCHHGACAAKDKEWPRADNFRSHVRKIHHIYLSAEDSLEAYICRPANPEILSNVGVAPELIPPPVHGSSVPPGWSQLEQDAHVSMTGSGASGELRLNPNGCLPPPVRPDHRSTLQPQQVNNQNFAGGDSVCFDLYPRQEAQRGSQGRTSHGKPSGGVRFVRPNDLNTRRFNAMDGASPARKTEGDDAIVLGYDEDDEAGGRVGTPERTNNPDGDYQVQCLEVPALPLKPVQGLNELETSPAANAVPQYKKLDEAHSYEETTSSTNGHVKSGSFSPSDRPSTTGSSKDPDETSTEEAEAELQKLMLELEPSQAEKLLRTYGYVKPKEPQSRPRKAAQGSSHVPRIPCPDSTCDKTFKRPCEMKKHLKRHERPYGCTRCTTRFGSKSDWKRHENSQHFQHEIWKCNEPLGSPLSTGVCNKVCHRRETFKQHLVSHHGIRDTPKQEDRLEKCRIGRPGEARFWCGFCRDVVELPKENQSAASLYNARYNHVDDHFFGRNGAVKKDASEWLYDDSDAESDVELPPPGEGRTQDGAAVLSHAEGSRKRSRHVASHTPTLKRVKTSPPSEDIMWYCCQCNNAWNVSNVPSCLTCPAHVRCNDCTLEEVKGRDEDQVTMS